MHTLYRDRNAVVLMLGTSTATALIVSTCTEVHMTEGAHFSGTYLVLGHNFALAGVIL